MGGFIDKFKNMFSMEEEEEDTTTTSDSSFLDDDSPRRPNLIPISSRKTEILVLYPTSYQEALQAADQIKKKRILILNLERADYSLTSKIIEFLRGVTFGHEGHMENIAENIFLFTPHNIGIRCAGKKDPKARRFTKTEGGSQTEWNQEQS